MSDEETSHIMFLKEQILRFAAPIIHRHNAEDIDGLGTYAPENHASSSNKYGVGSKNNYGHVKVDNETSTTSTNPVQNKIITSYINSMKETLESKINESLIGYTIKNVVDSSSTDEQIPTAKAVWDALKSYNNKGSSITAPKEINADIDDIVEPGYYTQTEWRYFVYGGEKIYYKNALIRVEKGGDGLRIIQHVYATSLVTHANGTKMYRLNGSEYTRWGTASEWKAWHVAHKPYTKTMRASNLGENVYTNSVEVYENTAGFIIHWNQERYDVHANQNQYANVCEFYPSLPVSGHYIFSNLIGRLDIRIDRDKMQIRSNVPSGGYITGVYMTFFVPRNQ